MFGINEWLMFTHPQTFVVALIVIVVSISLHEFGHAISADRLGDDTPRRQGRVTLWPDKHFDPIGFIFILVTLNLGRGIGWGKPVMVDFYRLRHPRRDMFLVAACGPLMNLILATVAGLILRISYTSGHTQWLISDTSWDGSSIAGNFVFEFLSINLALMFFNLIPVHPLDGSKILSSLLPTHQAVQYERMLAQYGPMILMAICWLAPDAIWTIIGPPVSAMMHFLGGPMVAGGY
jgi:Zn-dependent protease